MNQRSQLAMRKFTLQQPAFARILIINILFLLICLSCGSVTTQSETALKPAMADANAVPFAEVYVKPHFESGCGEEAAVCFRKVLDAWVLQNFRYPERAINRGIKGIVDIKVGIRPNGKVAVVGVSGPHPTMEQASLEILQNIPNVYAGKNEAGDPVAVEFDYQIHFEMRTY